MKTNTLSIEGTIFKKNKKQTWNNPSEIKNKLVCRARILIPVIYLQKVCEGPCERQWTRKFHESFAKAFVGKNVKLR
jgi:predicted secreted protein